MNSDRRDFIRNTLKTGAMLAITPNLLSAEAHPSPLHKDGDGFKFLFQGDSITDGNRTRNTDWNHVMGHGYQYIISSKLWYDQPEKQYQFFNRGISGNKVTDLTARWQTDTLDLKPDILSVLIGINDVTAFINGNESYAADKYESGYRSLLVSTRQALPAVQFILCEPFVLNVGKSVGDRWAPYSLEVKKRQEVVRRLSKEFEAVFVPFQDAFDKALARAPAEYWIWDGIHPMPAGHELMALEWLKQVKQRFAFLP